MPPQLIGRSYSRRVAEAADRIDEEGEPEQGGNSQAEYDARYAAVDGYYPGDRIHLIAVDLDDDRWLHSMTISVASQLRKRDLMYNSFYLDEFPGYHDNDPVEGDVVFHVVDASWLCNSGEDDDAG